MKQHKNESVYFQELLKSVTTNGRMFYAGRLLHRAAQMFGDETGLIFKGVSISYRTLYQRASALSAILKKHNVKPRDRVIMCFENSPEFYIAYYAVWQAGAVIAPINTFLKEVELSHIINDAQPTVIITSSDRVELFKKTNVSNLPPLLTEADMPQEVPVSYDEPIDLESDEMAALLYTSGTTGLPKGVMLSSRNIITNILQGVSRLQIGHHERMLGVLPLFHVFAQNVCVWSCLFVGATVIIVPKIDRHALLDGFAQKPTGFIGVPALYGLLCLMKTVDLGAVKYFVSGGDALPDKIRSYFSLLYRRKICNGYGLTETSPIIAVDFDDVAQPTGTLGLPVEHIAYEIRDEQGRALPAGSIGELWVKGDNIMLGYYNAPEATAQVLKDGWFNTGDMMYIAPSGKLVITGRTKDLIINKGINIYPPEIENIIMSHPNVIRVAVVGQLDEASGEVPVAFVQLRTAQEGIEAALHALCVQHLASYKIPRSFRCSTEDLPMTATSKVDKKVLRKLLQS